MSKVIRQVFKNEKFQMHECTDGFYLYDFVQGYNISMRAKTEQEAFIEALEEYQKDLSKCKAELKELNTKIGNFISQFNIEDYEN